jgi:LPXTG-motif cell wall-anchored protein
VSLQSGSVAAGGQLSFSATGFAPGETVDVIVHSDPVVLDPVTADANGAISASRDLPADLPAGPHELVLTGATSGATASATFTAAASATCELADGVKGGSLTWGFKKSFRSYVAGPTANSIIASDGAKILDQDLAIAGKSSSGAYQWPFVSSSAYTSPTDFAVQYGGAVEFEYPAHYFDIVISHPRLVVHGTTGTMYADVTLTVSAPGSAPDTSNEPGVELASLDLSDPTPSSSADGVSLTVHTAILDTDAFSFEGSSFYQQGEQLDDASLLLSGCVGAEPTTASTDPTATATDPNGGGIDSDLVPDRQYRPAALDQSSLPDTGSDPSGVLTLAAIAVVGGIALTVAGQRRRNHPKGAHR